MVYNTYYGTGYNNSTLIEPKFEMISYSTQVVQLQFEYIYELYKICLVGQGMGQGGLKMIFRMMVASWSQDWLGQKD
jgi:hypothetical protein